VVIAQERLVADWTGMVAWAVWEGAVKELATMAGAMEGEALAEVVTPAEVVAAWDLIVVPRGVAVAVAMPMGSAAAVKVAAAAAMVSVVVARVVVAAA
tara:strand:- start:161 stop:454 length:294 start_codon:yes stop_codon:yes gene_type:complete